MKITEVKSGYPIFFPLLPDLESDHDGSRNLENEKAMKKALTAILATLTVAFATGSAFAGQAQYFVGPSLPIHTGPSLNDTGSQAYPEFTNTLHTRANAPADNTGSARIPDSNGQAAQFGTSSSEYASRNNHHATY